MKVPIKSRLSLARGRAVSPQRLLDAACQSLSGQSDGSLSPRHRLEVSAQSSTGPNLDLVRHATGTASSAEGVEQPSHTATDAGNDERGLLRAPQPTNGKQLADFRLFCAVAADRELTVPELIMLHQIFVDDNYVSDMRQATVEELNRTYLVDPDKPLPDGWYDLQGQDWVNFLRNLALPPWMCSSRLIETGLPKIPLGDNLCGPIFVRAGKFAMRVVSQLNFRDIAHSTAGTLLKPKLGRTYAFRDFFPAPPAFTFEDACRAHGFSASRTQLLAGRSSSPGIFVRRRARSPERISQYLRSSPAAHLRELSPSPSFPSPSHLLRGLSLPSPSLPPSGPASPSLPLPSLPPSSLPSPSLPSPSLPPSSPASPSLPPSSPPSSSPAASAPEQDGIEASVEAALDQTILYASPSPRFMPGSPQLSLSSSLSYVEEEEEDTAAAVVMSSSEHGLPLLPIAPSSPSSSISSLSYASDDGECAADIAARSEVAAYAPASPPFAPSSPQLSSPSSFEGYDLASNAALDEVAAPSSRSPSFVPGSPASLSSSPWEHALEEDSAEPATGSQGNVATTSDTEVDDHCTLCSRLGLNPTLYCRTVG
ncbi:hypothetical protein EV122DRAFT_256360 [Schizophyllum commune]